MEDALLSLLNLVLEAGGNVNTQNERLETPLMFSLINVKDLEKRAAVIDTLLKFGADVNAQNSRGQTPFMYACILNQLQTLTILLNQKKIDVNLQDCEGNTGLMYACALGHYKTVQKLLEEHVSRRHTFKFSVENNEGITALQYAEDGYFVDIVSMLSEIISMPSYTRPVKSTEAPKKAFKDRKIPQRAVKPIKTTDNNGNTNKEAPPRGMTQNESPSESNGMKQRELDEINDLVRSVRQCAADIKQICTDHDIDYKGEKKNQRTEDVIDKSNKKNKIVSSDSASATVEYEKGPDLYEKLKRRSNTYPRRYKTKSSHMKVPDITLTESRDIFMEHSSPIGTKKYPNKPSFVSKTRLRMEDITDAPTSVFKSVSKHSKLQARSDNRLSIPIEQVRPSSQNTTLSKSVNKPQPRSMSTSLEIEKGMSSKSKNIGPSINEVQPLLNKIWSSYKKPLPSISKTNGPDTDQSLHLPPLREGHQSGGSSHQPTIIRMRTVERRYYYSEVEEYE